MSSFMNDQLSKLTTGINCEGGGIIFSGPCGSGKTLALQEFIKLKLAKSPVVLNELRASKDLNELLNHAEHSLVLAPLKADDINEAILELIRFQLPTDRKKSIQAIVHCRKVEEGIYLEVHHHPFDMERWSIDGIQVNNWKKNREELATLNGLPRDSILIHPPRLGKTEMIRLVTELAERKR